MFVSSKTVDVSPSAFPTTFQANSFSDLTEMEFVEFNFVQVRSVSTNLQEIVNEMINKNAKILIIAHSLYL